MQESTTSKEKILKKIRKALINKSDVDYKNVDFESEIFPDPEESLEILFAKRLTALNGKFVFCENKISFIENLSNLIKQNNWSDVFCFEDSINALLKQGNISFSDSVQNIFSANIGITLCECLVARTGSVFVTSRQISGRRLPVYSNIHIVVAYTSQLVYNIKDALKLIQSKYEDQIPSMIANITGPSRTADIEKTLVQGAHGPKEIFVFLIDDHKN